MRKPKFLVKFRLSGEAESRKTISLSQDRRRIAEVTAQVWGRRPDEVEVLDVQWFTERTVRTD